MYLFGAHKSGGELALVDPEQAGGGHVLRALSRLSGVLETAQPVRARRSISLVQISDSHNASQFGGNGSADYPPLYDREVLFVQPLQLDDRRFLVSVHVATRNALESYPPKAFSITLAGLNGHKASLTAMDPMSGGPVPVTVLARGRDSIRFSLPVGSAPRLVTLAESS